VDNSKVASAPSAWEEIVEPKASVEISEVRTSTNGEAPKSVWSTNLAEKLKRSEAERTVAAEVEVNIFRLRMYIL
jgi:hypothetical protein